MLVSVGDAPAEPPYPHLHPQLFVQLPGKRLSGPLPRLDFSAGELPEPPVGAAGQPLGEEDATSPYYEPTHNVERR